MAIQTRLYTHWRDLSAAERAVATALSPVMCRIANNGWRVS
jgi:hypothetical protein